MKSLIVIAILAAGTTVASSAIADPAMDSNASHTGNYVRDSIITTKVKTKLAAKHMETLTDIQVDTDDAGIVWLSGKAPTQDASDLAEMIAKDTDGVRNVHNSIVVKH